MIGCLRTPVRKQPIIALYFEPGNELKLYNLEAWCGYRNRDGRNHFNCLLAENRFPDEIQICESTAYFCVDYDLKETYNSIYTKLLNYFEMFGPILRHI